MKVVALISGGKDSCYNMVLCERYGHEVVALANLLPVEQGTEDMDSYMYQTVGHQVIAAYAECLGLPLFRRRITGSSKDQRLVYEDTNGDEVEDLLALLSFVKQTMPEVGAVSSGAIASDYQRTRVERVCSRLGLVSLAYMWHQPQSPLLQSMIEAGIHAVLVKVAAAGLRPERHLGASLSAMLPQLQALRQLYGCNVCGEGGEYETLTLDCPLFRHGRIVLDSWDTTMVCEDSMAPVALLRPGAFHVEPKQPDGAAAGAEGRNAASAEVIVVPDDHAPAEEGATSRQPESCSAGDLLVNLHTVCGTSYVTLSAEVAGDSAEFESQEATSSAMGAALQRIHDALPPLGLSWSDSLFVHLYVPSMAQFAAANAAYAGFLPAVNPPSRATVQLAPNGSTAMVVEVLLARPSSALRRVLHVQSISEWAPSCIGPYSQALMHCGLVHFAGQIPLDPGSMAVIQGDARAQAVRSLQSCQAVAVAMRTDLPNSMLWCTVYCSEAVDAAARGDVERAVHAFLQGSMEEATGSEQAQPAADGEAGRDARSSSTGSSAGEEEVEELDEYLVPPAMKRHWGPLLTFVTVPHLPRGVLAEIQPVAWAEDPSVPEPSSSSSDDDAPSRRRYFKAASGMPGWIRGVERKHASLEAGGARVEVHSLASPGRFARLQASVDAELPLQSGDAGAMAVAAQAAATELSSMLQASGMEASDVASAKMYLPSGVHTEAGAVDALRQCVADSLGGIGVVAVPVGCVGTTGAADGTLVLEVLAIKS